MSFYNGLGLIDDDVYMTADDHASYGAYMWTIPEPTTLGLLLFGGLALLRRRR